MVMTEEVAGISQWWFARGGEAHQFSILNYRRGEVAGVLGRVTGALRAP